MLCNVTNICQITIHKYAARIIRVIFNYSTLTFKQINPIFNDIFIFFVTNFLSGYKSRLI